MTVSEPVTVLGQSGCNPKQGLLGFPPRCAVDTHHLGEALGRFHEASFSGKSEAQLSLRVEELRIDGKRFLQVLSRSFKTVGTAPGRTRIEAEPCLVGDGLRKVLAVSDGRRARAVTDPTSFILVPVEPAGLRAAAGVL
ncbi:MAG: hypothetical protein AB1486_32775 [Planctomycetota bacterium]